MREHWNRDWVVILTITHKQGSKHMLVSML